MAVWIRTTELPIEYYDKHFLWKAGNKVGKTLKVDVHTIKDNKMDAELNSIKSGRFARINVKISLEKKTDSEIKNSK